MNDLMPNAKPDSPTALATRERSIAETRTILQAWLSEYESLVTAETNPLNTPADIERYRRAFRKACERLYTEITRPIGT